MRGGADAVSLINTISSITAVDLDTFSPEPSIDGKGSARRLLRPGGEADRAQHGGRDRPRPRDRAACRSPASAASPPGATRPSSWRSARGTVQVCTAAMTYGFRIVQEMISGLVAVDGREGPRRPRRHPRPRGAERHRLAVPEPQLRRQGADRPGPLHQVRPLLRRLRGHLAPGDRHAAGAGLRGEGRRVRRLQPLRQRLPGRGLHHHGARWRPATVDARTGKVVEPSYANWTTHPNNPMAKAAE